MKEIFSTKNVCRTCDMLMFAIEKVLDEAERRGHKSPELEARLKQLGTRMTEIEDKWMIELFTALYLQIMELDADVQTYMRKF